MQSITLVLCLLVKKKKPEVYQREYKKKSNRTKTNDSYIITRVYVLRGGKRGNVGNGSFLKSLRDLFVGDDGPFGRFDGAPVGIESGGRLEFVVVPSG